MAFYKWSPVNKELRALVRGCQRLNLLHQLHRCRFPSQSELSGLKRSLIMPSTDWIIFQPGRIDALIFNGVSNDRNKNLTLRRCGHCRRLYEKREKKTHPFVWKKKKKRKRNVSRNIFPPRWSVISSLINQPADLSGQECVLPVHFNPVRFLLRYLSSPIIPRDKE